MLAVKAAGMQYGVAEKATIIPVKVLASVVDLVKGFEMVAAHMLENKNQNKHNPTMSVVLCAMRSPMEEKRRDILADPIRSRILDSFKAIGDLGAPIVYASGNAGDETERADVDWYPGILKDPDTPLILVGAAKRHGGREGDSQGGVQVTIHAPGENIAAPNKDSKTEIFDGTSVGKRLFHTFLCLHPDHEETNTI
jgi:hypothetical protein